MVACWTSVPQPGTEPLSPQLLGPPGSPCSSCHKCLPVDFLVDSLIAEVAGHFQVIKLRLSPHDVSGDAIYVRYDHLQWLLHLKSEW